MVHDTVMFGFNIGRHFWNAKTILKEAGIAGRFESFVAMTGYSLRTSRSLISIYEADRTLPEAQRLVFEQLPQRLQRTMAPQLKKPEEERNQADAVAIGSVFKGDINSLPEYQALKRQVKDAENALVDKENKIDQLIDDNGTIKAQLKTKIESLETELSHVQADLHEANNHPVIVERMPDDYKDLKDTLEKQIDELNEIRRERDNKVREQEILTEQIKTLQAQMSSVGVGEKARAKLSDELTELTNKAADARAELANMDKIQAYLVKANELLDTALAPMSFSMPSDMATAIAVKTLVSRVKSWATQMEDKLRHDDIVIDGQIVE